GGVTNNLSDDASVITGYSSSLTTGGITSALWTSGLGFTDLNQFFASQEINTDGGLVGPGVAVSADGRTIAGDLVSRFGYVPRAAQGPTRPRLPRAGAHPRQLPPGDGRGPGPGRQPGSLPVLHGGAGGDRHPVRGQVGAPHGAGDVGRSPRGDGLRRGAGQHR